MSPMSAAAAAGKFVESNPSRAIEGALGGECRCSLLPPRTGAKKHLTLIPAIVLVLLPKCPLCLAAWFGILGSIGARSWLSTMWGTPLAVGLLSFAVGALAMRARRSHDPRPLLVGTLGAVTLLVGKCLMDAPVLLSAGLVLLMGASFWSSWSKSAAAVIEVD